MQLGRNLAAFRVQLLDELLISRKCPMILQAAGT